MVDFTLSDDQLAIRDMAARFAREVVRPAEIELDKMSDPEEAFRSALFRDTMRQAYASGGRIRTADLWVMSIMGEGFITR